MEEPSKKELEICRDYGQSILYLQGEIDHLAAIYLHL